MSVDLSDPISLLALMALPGVGRKKAIGAATRNQIVGDPDRFYREHSRMSKLVTICASDNITVSGLFCDTYPTVLKELHDPPAVLFMKGASGFRPRQVTVIGSRKPERSSVAAIKLMVPELARKGWVTISGLAAGIDTVAHQQSLKHETPTIAVLPSGLNRIYPKQNEVLSRQIIATGMLISEYLPNATAERYRFVERDRIQAALSRALIVADTGMTGGTLHTVRFAAELGRPVFCPSGENMSPGVKALLETPACDLFRVLPGWDRLRNLCETLGDQPLAVPFDPASPETLTAQMEELLPPR